MHGDATPQIELLHSPVKITSWNVSFVLAATKPAFHIYLPY